MNHKRINRKLGYDAKFLNYLKFIRKKSYSKNWCVKHQFPTELVPTELVPTELVPTELVPTELVPTELVPTELVPTELVPTELVPTELVPTEWVRCEPFHGEPAALCEQVHEEPARRERVLSEPATDSINKNTYRVKELKAKGD